MSEKYGKEWFKEQLKAVGMDEVEILNQVKASSYSKNITEFVLTNMADFIDDMDNAPPEQRVRMFTANMLGVATSLIEAAAQTCHKTGIIPPELLKTGATEPDIYRSLCDLVRVTPTDARSMAEEKTSKPKFTIVPESETEQTDG